MTDELPRYPRLASWLWREPGLRFVHVTVSNTASVLRLNGRKNRRRRLNEGGENTKNINTIRHLQWNYRVDIIWIDPPFKDFLARLKTALFKKLLIWDITILSIKNIYFVKLFTVVMLKGILYVPSKKPQVNHTENTQLKISQFSDRETMISSSCLHSCRFTNCQSKSGGSPQ